MIPRNSRLILTIFIVFFIILSSSLPLIGQDDTCPTIVAQALEVTHTSCEESGRNQICLGNISVLAEPRTEEDIFTFSMPGDLVDISSIQKLTLSSYNEVAKEWGVALMRVQANLPETTPGQNVTFLVFGDVEIEDTSELSENELKPYQAFFFQSGIGDAPCQSAPDSGIIIQTPEGVGQIEIAINEVKISLNSTIFIQAQPNGDMFIYVLEGQILVTVQGVSYIVPAGTFIQIPLDENLRPAGSPSLLASYNQDVMSTLPIGNLPIEILIAPALDVRLLNQNGFLRFDDEIGDTLSCNDTNTSIVDPEVDITNVTIADFQDENLHILVNLGQTLINNFSFGLRMIIFDDSGEISRVLQWAEHDGNSFTGSYDFDQNAYIYEPDENGTVIEYNNEVGTIIFEVPHQNLPHQITGIYFESSHTPTSDTQPQPTTCDELFLEFQIDLQSDSS